VEADDLKALGHARHEARRWKRSAQMAEAILEEVLQITGALLGPEYGKDLVMVAHERIMSRATTKGRMKIQESTHCGYPVDKSL
jgi:hypothetical protein